MTWERHQQYTTYKVLTTHIHDFNMRGATEGSDIKAGRKITVTVPGHMPSLNRFEPQRHF